MRTLYPSSLQDLDPNFTLIMFFLAFWTIICNMLDGKMYNFKQNRFSLDPGFEPSTFPRLELVFYVIPSTFRTDIDVFVDIKKNAYTSIKSITY